MSNPQAANVLEQIVAGTRARMAGLTHQELERMQREAAQAAATRTPHRLLQALSAPGIRVIAEFKRSSPSSGAIRARANVSAMAKNYEDGGAAAMSVLTDFEHFGGSIHDLSTAHEATSLPLLRKDFIVHPAQLYEAAAAGASAVLLIAAILSTRELSKLRAIAEKELGLDTLVEVHDERDMQIAAECGARLIGINNRDLRTFKVTLETSERLAGSAPTGALLVSESGINSASDIRRLGQRGFRVFLVGECLMRAADPRAVLAELIAGGAA